MLSEDIHYELVPTDDENQQGWDVRILEGTFVETVVRFGAISVGDECLNFNFVVISSPDPDLDEDNADLQNHVTDLLESVLEKAIGDGTLMQGAPELEED